LQQHICNWWKKI